MTILNKTQINEIALALKSGKAVVLPTDTVWGIASLNEDQIYSIKRRAREKKVIMFVSSVDEVGLPSFLCQIIKKYWPGGLTIIWKNKSYRMPNCQYIIDVLKMTGPLFQSSANISGNNPVTSPQQVQNEFKESLNDIVIVDNVPKQSLSAKPSTIINLDNLSVVRVGEIDGNRIIQEIKERKP